ncbi:MAG: transcriptional regulator NrdR [Planctomycetota bacterium]
MICPYCGQDHDKVIDSRASDGGLVVRRRRECLECHRRYTTYERVEKTARLMVVKKDGSRVPFELDSVVKGLQAACGKRPVSEQAKLQIAHDVEESVHREFDREVPSNEIGKRVAAHLREVDEIAYIRYASEYHEFRTLDEFAQELSDLKARPKNLPNQQGLFPIDE